MSTNNNTTGQITTNSSGHITNLGLPPQLNSSFAGYSISSAYLNTGYLKITNPAVPYRKLVLFNIEYSLTKKQCPNALQRLIISLFLGGKWSKKDVALSLKIYNMLFGATIEL